MSALFRWPCSASIRLPDLSLLASALFHWRCAGRKHFCSVVSQVCRCGCPPFSAGHVTVLSCVSQVCHCRCPPFSVGHAAFVPQVCRCWCPPFLFICLRGWWCPPFSAGHVAFLFICLPRLSLLVSALFCWPRSISIRLSASPALLVSALFRWCRCWCPAFLFISQVCHCWCPPFSAGDATFLFVCLPGLSLVVRPFPLLLFICLPCLPPPFSAGHAAFTGGVRPLFLFICLVSALFRWPCSISIHLSPRSVTASVHPFPLAMQHFYSCVSQACHWLVESALFCWPFFCFLGLPVVCPCLLAMKHF